MSNQTHCKQASDDDPAPRAERAAGDDARSIELRAIDEVRFGEPAVVHANRSPCVKPRVTLQTIERLQGGVVDDVQLALYRGTPTLDETGVRAVVDELERRRGLRRSERCRTLQKVMVDFTEEQSPIDEDR